MILPSSLSSTYTLLQNIVHLPSRNVLLLSSTSTSHKYIAYKFNTLSEIEQNEIRFLSLTTQTHPHLLPCYSIIEDNTYSTTIYYCIVEYAEHNTLYHYILNNKKQHISLKEETIWRFLIQMLYAVYTLHMNGIIHNNIKLSNFYMFDNNTSIKLGGYKLCEQSLCKNEINYLISSLNYFYAAPEIINTSEYDVNSDIFSIGVCIYEMCIINDEYNQLEMYLNLLKGNIKEINFKYYSQELFDIITLMLNINNKRRPNVWELLNMKIIMNHITDINKHIDILSYGKGFLNKLYPLSNLKQMIYNFNNNKRKSSKTKMIKSHSSEKNVCIKRTSIPIKTSLVKKNKQFLLKDNNITTNHYNTQAINEKQLIYKKINERKSHSRTHISHNVNTTFNLPFKTTSSFIYGNTTSSNNSYINSHNNYSKLNK